MVFPEKAPPVFLPPRLEPGAQDASPWLLPEIGASGAPRAHGHDLRPVLSSAANLIPRHTSAAAERSAPKSPRTAGGAPPPPTKSYPCTTARPWSATGC